MASEVTKPDFSYQWSSGGSIVAPSNVKIQTGWTAEVPPFQWENWSQNRQDNAILHLFQKGISEWDAASNYYFTASGVRSYVQGGDGQIYVAVQDSIGQNPTTDTTDTYWKLAFIDTTSLAASSPVIGGTRNLKASVTAATATTAFTADEVLVGVSLTGTRYKLSAFNKSINLGTVGAGGMDTGLAPVSGYVAIYAIYNPLTGVSALLATNATAAAQPEVYGGVNMPAGYTASSLISIWRTDASRLFTVGYQIERRVYTLFITLLDINSDSVPLVSWVAANYLSFNTKTFSGQLVVGNNAAVNTSIALNLAASSTGVGGRWLNDFVLATGTGQVPFFDLPVITPQTFYTGRVTGSAPARYQIVASDYTF